MDSLISNISIQVRQCIYLKDPASSDLGRRILEGSIDLIDEIGFEQFTFRKLAANISSTEASVYRYFESKHKLLLYLTSWYWGWLEYRLVFALANVEPAEERLMRAIKLLTESTEEDGSVGYINEVKLNGIVISESSKTFLTRDVDDENAEGVFAGYKKLVERVSDIIIEINPAFKYPHMLISTVIEGSHHQRYFADHLPKLTDVLDGEDSIVNFYVDMVFKTIK